MKKITPMPTTPTDRIRIAVPKTRERKKSYFHHFHRDTIQLFQFFSLDHFWGFSLVCLKIIVIKYIISLGYYWVFVRRRYVPIIEPIYICMKFIAVLSFIALSTTYFFVYNIYFLDVDRSPNDKCIQLENIPLIVLIQSYEIRSNLCSLHICYQRLKQHKRKEIIFSFCRSFTFQCMFFFSFFSFRF